MSDSADSTEYKEGDHSEFIVYLFSSEPKPRNTIVLESPPLDPHKNRGLHIFEQLLMIFVDGLKYFYGKRLNQCLVSSYMSSSQIFVQKNFLVEKKSQN